MKHFLNDILILLLISLTFATHSIFSQDTKQDSSKNVNSLQRGSWVLLFQIDRNFSLRDFQGSTISVKRHLSGKSAIRVGITLNARLRDYKNETKLNNSFDNLMDSGDETSIILDFNTQYLFYLIPDRTINLFTGVGPYLGYRYLKSEGKDQGMVSDTLQATTTQNRKSSDWNVGLSLALGVEWFANKSISFLAEYGTIIYYFNGSDRITRKKVFNAGNLELSESKGSDAGYQIRSETVKFGISLYF